jgi:hypothetical protein
MESKLIVLLLAFITSTFPSTSTSETGAPIEDLKYTNTVSGWAISYPRGWTVDATTPGDVRFYGPNPNWILGVHTAPGIWASSEDLANVLLLRAYPSSQFKVVSRQSLKLPSGLVAIEIIHHVGVGVVGKSRKIVTVVNGRGFLIDAETYLNSWNSAEPFFTRMIDSFTVEH